MNKDLCIFFLSGMVMSSSVMAGVMGPIDYLPDWNWVGTISAGPVWSDGSRSQTISLTPEIIKTYVARQSNNILFNGEVFAGLQACMYEGFQGQLGLAIAATSSASQTGIIWDDANPLFDNYTYRYNVQHTYIGLKGKIIVDQDNWLMPWVSASIGVGFNGARSYHNTPLIYEAIPNANFSSHGEIAFSYTLGLGVQKALNEHWQVGVGYEFADWGKSALGRASGQTQNSGLSLNHLYTNGALINLTYLS